MILLFLQQCASALPEDGRGPRLAADLVRPGDVVAMAAGCKHTVIADTPLQLIEVQLGDDISVFDKHKYAFDR